MGLLPDPARFSTGELCMQTAHRSMYRARELLRAVATGRFFLRGGCLGCPETPLPPILATEDVCSSGIETKDGDRFLGGRCQPLGMIGVKTELLC